MRGEEDHDRHHRADQHIVTVHHPEHRHVEDEIAKRAATDAGDAGQEQEADDVELLARGRKRTRRREDGNTGVVEKRDGVQGHGQ